MDKELIKEMIDYIEKTEDTTEVDFGTCKKRYYPEIYYKLKEWLDDDGEIAEVNYVDGKKSYYKNGEKMY